MAKVETEAQKQLSWDGLSSSGSGAKPALFPMRPPKQGQGAEGHGEAQRRKTVRP